MKNSNNSPPYFMNIFKFGLIRHFDNNKVMKVLVSLDLSQKIGDGTFRSRFFHFDAGCTGLHCHCKCKSIETKDIPCHLLHGRELANITDTYRFNCLTMMFYIHNNFFKFQVSKVYIFEMVIQGMYFNLYY